MTRLPYDEGGLAKPWHIDPVLINAMTKETGMIECQCGNALRVEMDTTRAQTEYEQYQERVAKVRDRGHDQIQKIYEDIRRKIETLYDEFHSQDEEFEKQP